MGLSKKQRAIIREMFGGFCAYCGYPLGERWHADHVEPLYRITKFVRDSNGSLVVNKGRIKTALVGSHNPQNERLDNYFPACISCNIDKASEPLEMWRKHLQDKCNIALRASTPLRHAQRFGLVQFSDAPIVFYFESFTKNREAGK